MKSKTKLTPSMTLKEFENGYWFATELKEFADDIGVPSVGKLRKDELERAIKLFLETGEVTRPTMRKHHVRRPRRRVRAPQSDGGRFRSNPAR